MLAQGSKVTVVGLGVSGLSTARLLRQRGAEVTVNDHKSAAALGPLAEQVVALGAKGAFGGHDADQLAASDLIVVSPGVPPLPALAEAARRGVRIVSEVELASWFLAAPLVAVTGTNGKSTVTTLIGEMSKASGVATFVGGNLGAPLAEAPGTPAGEPEGRVVVELSSFQLERIDRFRADVAVLLNITDDHLDRYPTFAAYAAAKGRIFASQRRADRAVVPAGDALCAALARAGAAQIHTFGGADGEVRIDAGHLVDRASGLSLAVAEIGLEGAHNLENACAAALAARLAGIDSAAISQVLTSFRGLSHRMCLSATLDGVRYYDDSKATNVGAAVAAVLGLGRGGDKVVLIAGGKDKGGSYEPLVAAMRAHGRALVVLGEAAPLIADAFAESTLPVERARDMGEAVSRARALARSGDAVLLAPACASFDMFRSYAHRGDAFQAAVNALREEGSQ